MKTKAQSMNTAPYQAEAATAGSVYRLVSRRRWGTQTRSTWRDLAHECASDSVDKVQKEMARFKEPKLTAGQKTVVFAMMFGSIIAAMSMVAEEAVKGEDVQGAVAD